MSYRPGDAYHTWFTTQASNGAAADAAATPVAIAARNGSDDPAMSLTVSHVATGVYRVSGAVPESWQAGDVVSVRATASVGGVSAAAVLDTFVVQADLAGRLADVTALLQARRNK